MILDENTIEYLLIESIGIRTLDIFYNVCDILVNTSKMPTSQEHFLDKNKYHFISQAEIRFKQELANNEKLLINYKVKLYKSLGIKCSTCNKLRATKNSPICYKCQLN